MSRNPADQFVYFLRPVGMAGPIKIGCSSAPWTRMNHYNMYSPVPLELVAAVRGPQSVEFRFHLMFDADRMHHEWFRHSPELQAVMDAVGAGTFDLSTLPTGKVPRKAKEYFRLQRDERASSQLAVQQQLGAA